VSDVSITDPVSILIGQGVAAPEDNGSEENSEGDGNQSDRDEGDVDDGNGDDGDDDEDGVQGSEDVEGEMDIDSEESMVELESEGEWDPGQVIDPQVPMSERRDESGGLGLGTSRLEPARDFTLRSTQVTSHDAT